MHNKQTTLITTVAIILAAVLFISLTSANFNATQTIGTNLTVIYNNVAPNLTTPIPNQTWAINTNLTNVFDLDDYFTDNETLTYTNSSVQNITVVINTTTNTVSFYPDWNFTGIRNVTFTAFDGFESTTSNVVYLNVTEDTQPPTWNNTQKNATTIASGETVIFYADWQDNIGLRGFTFSINQGSGYVTTSEIPFSGLTNTSEYTQVISAAAGTTVSWRFYGYDTSGNVNVTDEQTFVVAANATTTPPSSGGGSGGGGGGGGGGSGSTSRTTAAATTPTPSEAAQQILDFTVEPENFKLEMKQGSSATTSIKITNTGNTELQFSVSLSGFDPIPGELSETIFNLTASDSKTITASFAADKLALPDFYYGKILVTADANLVEVPGAVLVKAINNSFDINVSVPFEYKNVKQGELASAEILLKNIENLEERDITLYYAITNFEGSILNSETEETTFSGRETLLSRNLSIPFDAPKGEYLFIARGVSGEEIALDSDTLLIGEKFSVLGFIKANLILASIILASVIIAGFMVKHHRNKEKIRLLNLYLMMSRMNKLIKEGKIDEAIEIYMRIKTAYGEPVAKASGENREKLKEDMEELAKSLDMKIFNKPKPEEKKSNEKDKKAGEGGEKQEGEKDEKSDSKDVSSPKRVDEERGSSSKSESEKITEQKEKPTEKPSEEKPAPEEKPKEETPKEKVEKPQETKKEENEGEKK